MHTTRRRFLQTTVAGAAVAPGLLAADKTQDAGYEQIDRAAAQPVLRVESLGAPVTIASMELLRIEREFLVRVRSTDGAEGLAIPNSARLIDTYPIFLNHVAPFFVGQDARRLELLLWELYRYHSNYKLQGLAFWVCLAAAEFAIFDLLGKLAGKSIGELLGGVLRRDIPVYRASGVRGNRPEEEVKYLQRLVTETGAGAVKFRVGGRMSKNEDSLPGRTETLIPLVRKTLGDDVALYADSNSSYDARHAIRIGRLMQEHDYGFFEEPCRFDHLEETKEVADALAMPVAGGEQEFSMRRFRWTIRHRAVDVVQPDLHYYGGFIRSMRVARMAHAAGLACTPHMSGSGLGYLDMAHFVSAIPNPAPHHEFKGNTDLPVSSATSSLRCEAGILRVPAGPGFGIEVDPAFVRRAKEVTTL
jgi:L-alanine-DL-glutamate epimerase-like enolase superfamily enzyme